MYLLMAIQILKFVTMIMKLLSMSICFIFIHSYGPISKRVKGDICTLNSTGSKGVCKLLLDCQSAREELQKFQRFPQTCGFQGTQPIVCCASSTPTNRVPQIPGQRSLKKCREYSKYTIEKKPIPTLSLDDEAPSVIEKNECGHKVVRLIVGGEPAGRKEFPHMAGVGYGEEPGKIKWLCGGSIISENFVLTAAHCLVSQEFGPAKFVRVGVTDLNDNGVHNQEIPIAQRIAYPEYKSRSHYHDIGLLRLEKLIKLDSYTVPACLYTKSGINAEMAIATGWGNTAYAGVTSNELLKVTLDFFDHQTCNSSYKNQIGRKLMKGIIDDIQVCAGSKNDTEKDTCQGDSGGPLQIFHINDDIKCMYDVVGVTSFGKACSGNPGVYARVSHYIEWIEDIVWPENS